ncbi:MAG TPA: hypothetical protein PLE60_14295, partial [Candidatus Latescibacteria bacterium]|nr:hypothetical protein [Candidatus Latescibacterota bacterium]
PPGVPALAVRAPVKQSARYAGVCNGGKDFFERRIANGWAIAGAEISRKGVIHSEIESGPALDKCMPIADYSMQYRRPARPIYRVKDTRK